MIYDRGTPGNGVWHCPFAKEWVERMKKAAKHCENLSAEYIERTLDNEWLNYQLPPGDFLSEEQDAMGLPLSFCEREEGNHRRYYDTTAIYDYDSIPELVITNGKDDWPLERRGKILHA